MAKKSVFAIAQSCSVDHIGRWLFQLSLSIAGHRSGPLGAIFRERFRDRLAKLCILGGVPNVHFL